MHHTFIYFGLIFRKACFTGLSLCHAWHIRISWTLDVSLCSICGWLLTWPNLLGSNYLQAWRFNSTKFSGMVQRALCSWEVQYYACTCILRFQDRKVKIHGNLILHFITVHEMSVMKVILVILCPHGMIWNYSCFFCQEWNYKSTLACCIYVSS